MTPRLWPKTMRRQMALVLAVLTTVPLVALGTLLIRTSQSAVQTSVSRDQVQLVVRTASELGRFIQRPLDLLKATSAILGTLHADAWRQETALVELALGDEMFGRLSSIDLDGKETASSKPGTPAGVYSDDTAFRTARLGREYLSPISVSDDHVPYVTMAVPVRRLGETAGVLRAEVNLREFWQIVDQVRIGKTGRAYVVSENGVLIAHADKKKVLSNEIQTDSASSRARAGETGSLESAGADGRKYLKAFAPIPSRGWAVVVEQASDEAYAFVHWMKVESWILIAASLALAALFGLFLAPVLVNPIRELSDKMHRVSDGDLDQALPTKRPDEIGDLMRMFNQMTAKLKEARDSERLAVIGKAAAAITHELKNSLVMVAAFIGLLPKRHDDPNFLKQFSSVLPRELEGWKSMLEEISDYARHSRFELGPVDLPVLLDEFELVARERLADRKIRLVTERPSSLPPIRGNRQKLKQALVNLALNAVDASPDGGTIRVSAATENDSVLLSVADGGKGIAPEKLARIFEPFHTTKANHLGLGLAIVKEIVEYQGGTVEVSSESGKGSRFTLRFPAIRETAVSHA